MRQASLIIISLYAATVLALPEDRHALMQVRAGSADLDQLAHRGVFTSNVELDQGSTHIRATQAITTGNDRNQLIKATLKGDHLAQAHYWTTTAISKPPMHAYADLIHYYPEKHLIELIGHACVKQGSNSFSAPHIQFDTEQQRVITQANKTERTTIIIHPDSTENSTLSLNLNEKHGAMHE